MSDLSKRLRTYDAWQTSEAEDRVLFDEAADRIEELEETLREISESVVCAPTDYAEHNANMLRWAKDIARATLRKEAT